MLARPPRLNPTTDPKTVIVVGAGMSGLVAALELERAGHHVQIVEARRRIGGRVLTQRARDGAPMAEAGAGRIPRSHRWTWDYIDQMGLATRPLYPTGLKNVALIDGKRWVIDTKTDLAATVDLPPEEKAMGYAGLLKTHVLENVEKLLAAKVMDTPAWPPRALAHLDRLSIVDHLAAQGLSPAAIKLLTLGAFPTAISPLMLSRVLATYDRESLSVIEGGNDRLPAAIAAHLRGPILLNSPVRAIVQFADRIEIAVEGARPKAIMAADALICTIPFSVLGRVQFEPALNPAKQQILAEIRYTKATKVAFKMSARFWESEQLSGFAQLDTGAEIWSPRWSADDGSGVLQFYQQGERAAELDAMDEQARAQWAMGHIEKAFPGAGRHVQESRSYSWQEDPWAGGAYGIPQPGNLFRWQWNISSSEGRIYFAGEHTSEYSAWIEGAVRSGHRAATELHEATFESHR